MSPRRDTVWWTRTAHFKKTEERENSEDRKAKREEAKNRIAYSPGYMSSA
jgi:hypothetical protein